MTAEILEPVRFRPSTPPARRPLPLPVLPEPRTSRVAFSVGAIDRGGRVAARATVSAVDWQPGTRLSAQVLQGSLVLRPDVGGPVQVVSDGYLRVPAQLRHRCGLETGDRVLLTATTGENSVIIHSPNATDELLTSAHHAILGGGPA